MAKMASSLYNTSVENLSRGGVEKVISMLEKSLSLRLSVYGPENYLVGVVYDGFFFLFSLIFSFLFLFSYFPFILALSRANHQKDDMNNAALYCGKSLTVLEVVYGLFLFSSSSTLSSSLIPFSQNKNKQINQ